VNSAISAGKITATQKDVYMALLSADFNDTYKMLSVMLRQQSVANCTKHAAVRKRPRE
jgi:hypothetical protein